jgi:hypothetical protein
MSFKFVSIGKMVGRISGGFQVEQPFLYHMANYNQPKIKGWKLTKI